MQRAVQGQSTTPQEASTLSQGSVQNGMEQFFTKHCGTHPLLPFPSSVTQRLWTLSVPGHEIGTNRPKLLLNYFNVCLMNGMSLYVMNIQTAKKCI